MNNLKNAIAKGSLILMLIGFAGCDDFLNINTDPNNPLDSRLDQVLPTVQAVTFEALGAGPGGMSDVLAQFVHHTVQRGQSNFYFFAGNEFNIGNAWPNLYSGALKDIDVMITKAEARQSWYYLGVAQTMKAFIYSNLVDIWGKAVYTQFGQSSDNPFPPFDEGEVVYAQLFSLLDQATANFAKTGAENVLNDLIYGEGTPAQQISKWTRFANSLKLKLYNSVRKTSLYDATKVNEIIAADNMMSSVDDGFRLLYGETNNPENRHPLFIQDYVNNNANYIDPYLFLIMNGDPSLPEFNDVLSGIQDPRIPYYFYNQLNDDETPQNPTTSAVYGNFLSIWFASFNIDPNEGFDQAQSQTLVGLYPAGGAFDDGSGTTAGVAANQNAGLGGAGYQRLYPYFSHLYTRAELALTEGATGDHRELFEQAMRASMAEVNEIAGMADVASIATPDIDDYVSDVLTKYDAASDEGKLELIITQKWIASFGYAVDSYSDYRRTGYPGMFDPATDNNPFTILNRSYPVSLLYLVADLQINPNAGPQRNPATDKVFWDVD
jgi:hypothetical protein